tara:strand:+ start:23923 stop:25593 length:1671 start_codon:yes stop_codon:yes gene_type:complete
MSSFTRTGNILDFKEEEFGKHPELESHLAAMAVKELNQESGRTLIIDYSTGKRKPMKAGTLLAVAMVLGKRIKRTVPEKRVGIVLPPGIGAFVANLAITLIGKIPVNLNFTLGTEAIQSCIDKAGVETIITAKQLMDKVPHFPWTDSVIDLAPTIQSLSKVKIAAMLACVKLLPTAIFTKLFKIPTQGGDQEAALLFTSGSCGMPKGVPLTHRNIIANILQVNDCDLLGHDENIVGCLPIFHSFGFTVTMWLPMLIGTRIITLPSPLEPRKIADAIEAEQATIHIGTPTFFRPYLRKVDPEKLRSLKAVVAGAEKTPPGFPQAWEERFGCPYLEGYGLTETSPVVGVNLLKHPHKTNPIPGYESARVGSIGRPFIGLSLRVLNPETLEEQSPYEQGLLSLRGPNVFTGYLNNEEATAKAFENGWLVTGDLARFDEDGFLYVEGRLSRFSKIGGEMVPHIAVEQTLLRVLGMEDEAPQALVVTSSHDKAKGEALVILSTRDLDPELIREKLSAEGLPNLWIPKRVKQVGAIPMLATGKLDIQGCQRLAKEARVLQEV